MKHKAIYLLAAFGLAVAAAFSGVGPANAKPSPTFAATLTHDSNCLLTVTGTWTNASVAQVFAIWYQDDISRFTSEAPLAGPNGGTLRGRVATFLAGPFSDTGSAHSWTALVQFYDKRGAQLGAATAPADLTNCGVATA